MTREIHSITKADYQEVRKAVNETIAELRDQHPSFMNPDTRVRAIRAARLSATATAIAMKRREADATAREMAAVSKGRIDPMTEIDSRRGYNETVRNGITQAKRSDTPATLIMLDLNNIHVVNREQGRQEGDRQIQTVAHILRDSTDPHFPPARWGGDEYGVLHLGTDQTGASNWWQDVVQPRFDAENIHISAGAATYEPQKNRQLNTEFILRELTRRADLALYLAKTESKIQGKSLLFTSDEDVHEA